MANSNSFLSPYEILRLAQENKYLGKCSYFMKKNVYCVYSSESPHRGDSNDYIQHTIIVKEKTILNYRYWLPDLAPWLTLSGSNYPCLEQFSMVPKMFEPLKFDCTYMVGFWYACYILSHILQVRRVFSLVYCQTLFEMASTLKEQIFLTLWESSFLLEYTHFQKKRKNNFDTTLTLQTWIQSP